MWGDVQCWGLHLVTIKGKQLMLLGPSYCSSRASTRSSSRKTWISPCVENRTVPEIAVGCGSLINNAQRWTPVLQRVGNRPTGTGQGRRVPSWRAQMGFPEEEEEELILPFGKGEPERA